MLAFINLIKDLKLLKRYNLYGGSLDPYTSCVSEDESPVGEWIKVEDIDNLIAKYTKE